MTPDSDVEVQAAAIRCERGIGVILHIRVASWFELEWSLRCMDQVV